MIGAPICLKKVIPQVPIAMKIASRRMTVYKGNKGSLRGKRIAPRFLDGKSCQGEQIGAGGPGDQCGGCRVEPKTARTSGLIPAASIAATGIVKAIKTSQGALDRGVEFAPIRAGGEFGKSGEHGRCNGSPQQGLRHLHDHPAISEDVTAPT